MYKFIFFLFLSHYLVALDITHKVSYNEILSHSEIYIDNSKSESIDTIQNKKFETNTEALRSFGYSPDYYVWIKFTLTNHSTNLLHKVLEYNNPLTSHIQLFDTTSNILGEDGLLFTPKERKSTNPNFRIILQPNESKTFYIRAYSDITTLIVKLQLWNKDAFDKKELKHQIILALFFGAMGFLIIYNFFIYLSTRDNSYLYYVLFFTGITIHHIIYTGIMNIYIFSSYTMLFMVEYFSFIVAVTTIFLALFTKSILNIKQYPITNRVFNTILIVFPIIVILVHINGWHELRSTFATLILLFLFWIVMFSIYHKNRQANFIIFGWVLFVTSGVFMYLSSKGIYNVFSDYPYYTEVALVVESLIFSLSLADKIKQLHKTIIVQQEEEKEKLIMMVDEKTIQLNQLVNEKELLLIELNHRVKNSMQTIISFLRIKNHTIQDAKINYLLSDIENKVFSISELYTLLNTSENTSVVDMDTYFLSITQNLEKSFSIPNVKVAITTDIKLKPKYAVSCGLILNEALTNTYQHAFQDGHDNSISISLSLNNGNYIFHIYDNGTGFDINQNTNTSGLKLINQFATLQLNGEHNVDTSNGTYITIQWKEQEDA